MAQFFTSTLLRLRQVLAETGDSRSGFYQRIQDRLFPRPLKRGATSIWPAREVAAMNEAEISGWSDDEIKQLVRDVVAQRTAGEGQ